MYLYIIKQLKSQRLRKYRKYPYVVTVRKRRGSNNLTVEQILHKRTYPVHQSQTQIMHLDHHRFLTPKYEYIGTFITYIYIVCDGSTSGFLSCREEK